MKPMLTIRGGTGFTRADAGSIVFRKRSVLMLPLVVKQLEKALCLKNQFFMP
jgi:hypothetical protein